MRFGPERGLHALLLTLALPFFAGCEPQPSIVLLAPTLGDFIAAPSVTVSGEIEGDLERVAELTVNGVSALPLGPSGEFSVAHALDAAAIVNPILVELTRSNGKVQRRRVTVIAGDSVADGDFSPMGVALRLNDSGLDAVEPVITGLVDLDLASLVPAGTLVIDNFCYLDSIFGCLGRVDARISGSPPPSLSDFAIDVDAQTDSADARVSLFDLFVRANVDDATGVPLHCEIDIGAALTQIDATYALDPDAADPSTIDVTQLGGVDVTFGSFTDSTDCSGLLGGLVELLIGLFIGDVQDLMRPALEDFLDTTDAAGNTPIARAIETALAGIEIAGPIGESLGVGLEAPLFDVFEDVDGVTLDSDVRITASLPDPEAPDLAASFHIDEAFPSFGPTTPVGGQPYGLGLCISTSAFNQLLRAEIESGLLRTSITEIDLGFGPVPLTAGVLALVFPEFGSLDPAEPFQIDLLPSLAPIVSGNAGPAGEIAELRVGHLRALLVASNSGASLLEVVLDLTLGLEIDFVAGELVFGLGSLQPESVSSVVLKNTMGVNSAALETLLATLLPDTLATLADSLGTFPLPAFLGLQLELVEISKNGEFMSLFLNLSPGP